MNYLAVFYDHRIIDGREAVLFLAAIKETLEYPGRVLLDFRLSTPSPLVGEGVYIRPFVLSLSKHE